MLDPNLGCDVELPPDDRLTGDLVAPKWRVMSGGKIQVESKDDIRKRLGRSPDDGDAVMMAMAETTGSWGDVYRAPVEAEVTAPPDVPQRSVGWGDVHRPLEPVGARESWGSVYRTARKEPRSGWFEPNAPGNGTA